MRHLPEPMVSVLSEMLDLSLLKNRGMVLLCICNVFGMFGCYVPVIFIAPRAKKYGVSSSDVSLLLVLMGEIVIV